MTNTWMQICIELPENEGKALLIFLRRELGFTEIDWCEMQRPDRARAIYAPSQPRIDPFPREH